MKVPNFNENISLVLKDQEICLKEENHLIENTDLVDGMNKTLFETTSLLIELFEKLFKSLTQLFESER